MPVVLRAVFTRRVKQLGTIEIGIAIGIGLVPGPAPGGEAAFRMSLSATRAVDERQGADFDPDSDPDLEPTIMGAPC